ncbi:MAG: CRTAC1 family protein [Candidatus Poribacteria bacterium]|nr:CRTAC1 family protein [Candidatus Poribacteria bacterium]
MKLDQLNYLFLILLSNLLQAEPQVQFVDITASTGINFKHLNGAKNDYQLPETLGAGGAFFDYDNDGYLDLYLINSGDLDNQEISTNSDQSSNTSVLYRNNGDGSFKDVTVSAGISNSNNYGQGAAAADYDNDGDTDLYVTNFGHNKLYQNNGDGTFLEVSKDAGVADPSWSTSATFFDYDRDGYLDLYVVNYVVYSLTASYRKCYDNDIRNYCHPKYFEGSPDQLYRNNGDGTFTNTTKAAEISDVGGPYQGKGLGVVAADFNNDRYPDLYIANDDTPNYLFLNNGDGTFIEIGIFTGCAYSNDGIAQAGMGVDTRDYNEDGLLDIFVTNFSYETNALYQNNGDGTFTDVSYRSRLGEESYLSLGFGTNFLDYNNDGYLDLFIANGHISPHIEQTIDVVTYAQPNQLFLNNKNGTFTDISLESGPHFLEKAVSRGSILGDYDNDGDMDIVVTQLNGPIAFLRNENGNAKNWLRIRTVGTVSNRDGIGTRLTCKVGDNVAIREVRLGSSYLCSQDPRVLLGVSDHESIERIEVHWPSGITQVFEDIAVNQQLDIIEKGTPNLN